jgi:hypothetical protein
MKKPGFARPELLRPGEVGRQAVGGLAEPPDDDVLGMDLA